MIICTRLEQQLDIYHDLLIKIKKQKNCLRKILVIITVISVIDLLVF